MKRQIIKITESDMKKLIRESVEQILAENMEDEGFFGNLGNGFRRAMGAIGNDQSMGDAWRAGKQQFQNLQSQDRDINQYNKGYQAYQQACQKRDQLYQQYQQACQEVQKMSASLSGTQRQMGKDRFNQAKQIGRSGMDANQWDRQQRAQNAV